MNNSISTAARRFRWTALSLTLVAALATLFLASCKQGGANTKPDDVDYYTCTMHPSVKKQNPTDKCPICSMYLVPVMKKGAAGAHATTNAPRPATMGGEDKPGAFTVPGARQQLIGVTYP